MLIRLSCGTCLGDASFRLRDVQVLFESPGNEAR
ncbi:hypothetical protein BJB45_21695 [Halomonas huangheensis]|uniref:Uncharacterized protein n=1 Tax=Halomonas huangheensis TaxID=1178482 RepID=W1N1K8_9GAMM|nr:hypothetical protein BJB45_21695 [Halomonas huangheensis]